jgi:transcriptional regulator with XRE-family HTH domain
MTKNTDEQARFIELRAKGMSYQAIAEQINISKPTLLGWAKDFDTQIKEQRAIELQALLERYNASKMARVEGFAKLLQAIQAELDERIEESRGFGLVPAEKLLSMAVILDQRLGGEVVANLVEYGGLKFDNYKGVELELD